MSPLSSAVGLSILGSLGGLLCASLAAAAAGLNAGEAGAGTRELRGRRTAWRLADGNAAGSAHQRAGPESLRTLLAGILGFFMLEKLVLWRHCHSDECEVHGASASLVLIGGAVHNFVDGAVIGAALLTSVPLGISTAAAVAAHEVPSEIGDFAVLLHAGYSRTRALALNILCALASVVGAIGAVLLVDVVPQSLAVPACARIIQLSLCRHVGPDS